MCPSCSARLLLQFALGAEPFSLRGHDDANALEVEPLDPAIVPIASNHFRHLVVRTPAVTVDGFALARGPPPGRDADLVGGEKLRLDAGERAQGRNFRSSRIDDGWLEGGGHNRCRWKCWWVLGSCWYGRGGFGSFGLWWSTLSCRRSLGRSTSCRGRLFRHGKFQLRKRWRRSLRG
ncbi:AAEL009408-PA [Aedes aegypti]|uniref:AAEL009408-PA n=1 Tax=Aedes aegypti TaxID=7159 RepID=Q16VY9_AEDAE|nr:AAEL009408-PA [Aedes aegypti]